MPDPTPSYEVIDCHFHPAVDAHTSSGWFQSCGDMPAQIAALRRLGIARACGTVVRGTQPASFGDVRALNDQALALRDRFPDFYIPGIHIHPRFPDESCAEIARCCGREGVRWIGELVGYIMGYGNDYATADALTVFREAARHRAAVSMHCNDADVVERLCRGVPELNVVLAHIRADRDDILMRIGLVAQFPNLHLDISGPGISRLGVLRKAMDLAGKEKILFGTDYPVNNPAVFLHGALFEALRGEEYEACFSGNFKRLCT